MKTQRLVRAVHHAGHFAVLAAIGFALIHIAVAGPSDACQNAAQLVRNGNDTLTKDKKQAAKYYRLALNLCPSQVEAHFNLGLFYTDVQDYDHAIEQFQTIVGSNPKDIEAYTNLAWLLIEKKGDYGRGTQVAEQGYRAKEDWRLAALAAVGYYRMDRIAQAVNWLLHAKRADPAHRNKYEALEQHMVESQNAPTVTPTVPLESGPVVDVDQPVRTRTRMRRDAYAVVVGIGHYDNIPPADFADHDAAVMKSYLIKSMGFSPGNIVFLKDKQATLANLQGYLEDWLDNHVDKNSLVFVYYSGHGAPDPSSGQAYLVPYDGNANFLDKSAYPLKRLYASLGRLPTNRIIVMLDSCFSGAGGRSVIAKGTRPLVVSLTNPLGGPGKVSVLAASSGDEISTSYDIRRHGTMTYFMLKGLHGAADLNHDGSVELSELYRYVKPEVQSIARKLHNTDQVPQLIAASGGSIVLERLDH